MYALFTTFEWRHFFRLRMGKRAHPQIRQIAYMAWMILKEIAPTVFDRDGFHALASDVREKIAEAPAKHQIMFTQHKSWAYVSWGSLKDEKA